MTYRSQYSFQCLNLPTGQHRTLYQENNSTARIIQTGFSDRIVNVKIFSLKSCEDKLQFLPHSARAISQDQSLGL